MGRKDKQKKKVKGSEKNAIKTNKKLASEQKKMMTKLGEIDIIDSVTMLEEEQARLNQVTVSVCEPPTPRSSFSIVAHPEKEEIIIFGGEFFNGQSTQVYNDLYFYSIPKKEWKRVSSPSGPTPRSGHQMVSVFIDGGQLWLFGGEYASPSQSQFYHYKDLWMMSLKEMTWSKITSPNGPSARSGHRMVYAKKCLIIFGGFYDNYSACHYYNDIHLFSIESYQWEQIRIVGNIQPPPRSGCCIANTSDGKIVIWGGYSKTRLKKNADCGVTHSDMYCLTQDATDQCKYEWKKIKPKGYKPLPRSSVGFSPVINGVVYCFGGVMDVEEDDECLAGLFGDELYTLDVQNFSYHTVNIKSNQTKMHSKNVETTAEFSSNKISTDGNFTVTLAEKSDTSRRKLNENDTASASAPSARMKPGLCVCKNVLYLYGGLHEEGDKQNTLSDFYALNLSKLKEWEVLIPQKTGNHEWINSDDSDSDSNSSSSETSSSESDMDTD